jgi:hypothetical protein
LVKLIENIATCLLNVAGLIILGWLQLKNGFGMAPDPEKRLRLGFGIILGWLQNGFGRAPVLECVRNA